MKFKYNNNKYKFEDGKFYIYGGTHGYYISEVKKEGMIKILTEVLRSKFDN